MIDAKQTIIDNMTAPVRNIRGRVELYSGSALLDTYKYNDKLISFSVERVGANKFFGYGICHKLNVKLIDTKREIEITTENTLEALLGCGSDYVYPFPLFHVTEVNRDENTNELSITGYDSLNAATSMFYSELDITTPYTIKMLLNAISELLGIPVNLNGLDTSFELEYPKGANFEGSESIREVLDAIAEATQTIYYINSNWELTFKRLDAAAAAYEITKADYIELESKTNRRLSAITHATELGDNITASIDAIGSTQYVRDNPFWELRDDISILLDAAIDIVGGLTINQFSCSWRGNYLLEIGDRLAFTTKDGNEAYSFLLDDTITYNGTLAQSTQWSYDDNEAETDSNPTTLGDAIKQTYARVDKVNKEIEIVASKVDDNNNKISSLTIDTDSINATVSEVEKTVEDGFAATNEELQELHKQAALAVTAEDVNIAITNQLSNGIDSVTTTTGYTFNQEGLTVSKSDSEISTQITEDGMTISRAEEPVLTANNEGVQAEDLHATTYLIIGNNSRFEDYININGNERTGCFWIGG